MCARADRRRPRLPVQSARRVRAETALDRIYMIRTIDKMWMQDNLVHLENLVHPVKAFVSPLKILFILSKRLCLP